MALSELMASTDFVGVLFDRCMFILSLVVALEGSAALLVPPFPTVRLLLTL